MIERDLYV